MHWLRTTCVFLAFTGLASAGALSDHTLGPVRIGMTEQEVTSLPYRIRGFTVNEEGIYIPAKRIFVGKNTVIEAVFVNGLVDYLATRSKAYKTPEGAHVGNTLAELRRYYPNGHVNKGHEEGLYFSFATEVRGQVFLFDADAIGERCLLENEGCRRNLEQERSDSLRIF